MNCLQRCRFHAPRNDYLSLNRRPASEDVTYVCLLQTASYTEKALKAAPSKKRRNPKIQYRRISLYPRASMRNRELDLTKYTTIAHLSFRAGPRNKKEQALRRRSARVRRAKTKKVEMKVPFRIVWTFEGVRGECLDVVQEYERIWDENPHIPARGRRTLGETACVIEVDERLIQFQSVNVPKDTKKYLYTICSQKNQEIK